MVKKGGIDSLGVNSPSSIVGSPATPSGGAGHNSGSVKVQQESGSVALRNALQTSVRRSLRWRQQAMKSELSFLRQPSQIRNVHVKNEGFETKSEETKNDGSGLMAMVKRLDELDLKVRMKQSRRRLVDLTNTKKSPLKQIEESRAEDIVLTSEYQQVKDQISKFVDKNYYGVVLQSDFGDRKFINPAVGKKLLFKP